jgi:hypothetical protein
MAAAGRDMAGLELVGGTRAVFRDVTSTADLGEVTAVIEPQIEAGFSTFCIKPSQFTDDPMDVGRFCRDVIRRVDGLRTSSLPGGPALSGCRRVGELPVIFLS